MVVGRDRSVIPVPAKRDVNRVVGLFVRRADGIARTVTARNHEVKVFPRIGFFVLGKKLDKFG